MTAKRPQWKALLVIPLLMLVITRLLPALYNLALSFTKADFMRGLFRSPWVGPENFARLMTQPDFYAALGNTFSQTLWPLLVGTLVAVLAAILLPHIRSQVGRGLAFALPLLVSFLPAQLYFEAMSGLRIAGNPILYSLALHAMNCLPTIGIAVLAGGAGGILTGSGNTGIARLSGALLFAACGLARLFSTNLDGVQVTAGPGNTGQTLYQLEYRYGLIQMEVSTGSALRTVTNVLQLLVGAVALLLILLLLQKRETGERIARQGAKLSAFSLGLILLGAGLMLTGFVWCALHSAVVDGLLLATLLSLAILLLGGVVFLIYAIPAAAASASFERPVVPALLVLGSSICGGLIAEYMLGRILGSLNTILLPAFWAGMGCLTLAAYIAYFFYLNHRLALWVSVPLLGLALQSILTNVMQPLLYISQQTKFPLPLLVRYMQGGYIAGRGASIPLGVLTLLSLGLWAASSGFLFALPVAEAKRIKSPKAECC